MLASLAMLLFSTIAACSLSVKDPIMKWDLDTQEVSRKFRKDRHPNGKVDASWCDNIPSNAPKSYRQMHAMVVAAVQAERSEHRMAAMKWLRAYKCENVIACDELHEFYLGSLKARNAPIIDSSEKEEVAGLEKQIEKQRRKVAGDGPTKAGLCAPHANRAEWLELEYELFCPAIKTPPQHGLCPGCAKTSELQFQLEKDTHQMAMSSSFLEKFEHDGAADCSKPWNVFIQCSGGLASSYALKCSRKHRSVTCTETRQSAKLRSKTPEKR
jgi:hypothetical protein